MHSFLKILFIRHAQSTGNVEKRMQGQGDFPLTETGREQTEKLARRLITEGWSPSHVYSSPLARTLETTKILLNCFQMAALPAEITDLTNSGLATASDFKQPVLEWADELMEHQNGVFRGLTWGEAQAQFPELCQVLERSPDWVRIPEAETLEDARSRSRQFIQRLLERHQNGDRVWVVTHSWILQHLIAELLGTERSWRIHSQNTALFEFWIDHSRWQQSDQNRYNTDLWQIRRINDHQHLQG
ncbi:MAG TPA: histidine phosphatase family protein [Leptolyngbyaceae cyanobacterium M33_DOE_097]|uniref:Histidine phosphatase family protein n=1 Tax=Oscillatoriales cyanobacterium SpSt-418 TaxID=2282169 RepID=A0A7C3PCL9_9CYAN|nr:histidine phosphatase family protein [Leptolyngbyaceae cyanobacterium M33_DOE_097]